MELKKIRLIENLDGTWDVYKRVKRNNSSLFVITNKYMNFKNKRS